MRKIVFSGFVALSEFACTTSVTDASTWVTGLALGASLLPVAWFVLRFDPFGAERYERSWLDPDAATHGE